MTTTDKPDRSYPIATRSLEELMAAIPDMECEPGCNACCASVPMATQQEADAFFPARLVSISDSGAPHTTRITAKPCPKAKVSMEGKGCSIHDKRPFFCRIFGTVSGTDIRPDHPARALVCPRGRLPKTPLKPIQATSMMQEYFAIAAAAAKPKE